MSEFTPRLSNLEQDHVAAIGGEIARQVINKELAIGMPVGSSEEIDARIDANEQRAADGFTARPSGTNEGLSEAYTLGDKLKQFLETDMASFNSKHGVVELDDSKGVTLAVKNSIEKAMEAARQLTVSEMVGSHVNTHISSPSERPIEGTSTVDIDPATGRSILAFDMATPDGQTAKRAIFELFGVDETAMNESLPSAQGVSNNDRGYGISHRDQETRIPGIVLEERSWTSLPGADEQQFSQFYVKRAAEVPDTIESLF